VVDALFDDPRLAAVYDALDPDRSDLDVYDALVDELGAQSVLDVGCGTGTFACMLAARGVDVVGVDPAAASLEVARTKPGAERVRWIDGDAADLPPLQVDLAIMTGNVAQVFLTDDAWSATVMGIRNGLRPGGWFVFETRDPLAKAWLEWDRRHSLVRAVVADVGVVESWVEVTDLHEEFVAFRSTFRFNRDDAVLRSDSTLRFRGRRDLERSLIELGFTVWEVRDAPDRPGRELVFIVQRGD
jgi:SAM-dependent methyltransferase